MKLIIFIFILLFNLAESQNKTNITSYYELPLENKNNINPLNIDFTELQKKPKKYNKKFVRVYGFLVVKGKKNILFRDKNSYEHNDTKNAVIVMLYYENLIGVSDKINQTNVYVSGYFYEIQNNKFKSALLNIHKIEM